MMFNNAIKTLILLLIALQVSSQEIISRDTLPEFLTFPKQDLKYECLIYQMDQNGELKIESKLYNMNMVKLEQTFYIKYITSDITNSIVSTTEYFKLEENIWRKVEFVDRKPIAQNLRIINEVVARDTISIFDYDTYAEKMRVFDFLKTENIE